MKLRTIGGLLFTVLWTTGAVLLWFQLHTGDVRVSQLGEYIAGGVAPLALLWFVLAYYQQSEELRVSTEALQKQQEEIREQNKALQSLVLAIQHQVFSMKRKERGENEKDRPEKRRRKGTGDSSTSHYFSDFRRF